MWVNCIAARLESEGKAMAIAQTELQKPCLTYEEYLREGEVTYRYDVVDGIRVVPPAPMPLHQILLENLVYTLGRHRRKGGQTRPLPAPVDILIQKTPLRVRQPDLVAIAVTTYRQRNVRAIRGPLEFAPELVVEILSDSDREQVIAEKIADYEAIGVKECWIVRQEEVTVEVRTLAGKQPTPVAVYRQGVAVQSVVFPDLRVAVADIFAE